MGSLLKYDQLNKDRNEFRILTIYNDSDHDCLVRCALDKYSLSSPPEYYAMSYVWGDSKITKEITVNDIPFRATKNLELALRALRRRMTDEPDNKSFQFGGWNVSDTNPLGEEQLQLRGSQEIKVWVDAVCINQSDPAERDAQVLRMGYIYKQSTATIAWLGLSSDNSDMAFNLLRILQRKSPKDLYEAVLEMDKDNRYKREWKALANLLSRDYWSRIWILQEVALAKKVWFIAGPDSTTFESVMAALYGAQFRGENALVRFGYPTSGAPKDPCGFLKLCMKLWLKRVRADRDREGHNVSTVERGKFHIGLVNPETPLVYLLYEKSVSRFQSSEILDQVYGLLGLGTDSATLVSEPSYQTPLRDVMYGIYRALTERSQRLEWMLLSGGNRAFQTSPLASKTIHDPPIESAVDYERRTRHYNTIQSERKEGLWPSWLPDHSKGSGSSLSAPGFVEHNFHNPPEKMIFNATRNQQSEIIFNGPNLRCRGIIFDTILAPQFDPGSTTKYSKLTHAESFCPTSCPYADPAEVYKAIWHTISLPGFNPPPKFHIADKAWAFAEFWNDTWQHGKPDPREPMYMPLPPTDSESLDARSVSRRWGLLHDQKDMLIHGLPLREWVRRRTLDWSISEDRMTSGMGSEAGVEEFLHITDEDNSERPHIESLFQLCSLIPMSMWDSSLPNLLELKGYIQVIPTSSELFVTEKGYIGSRFKYCSKGEGADKVTLLFGCSSPVLLRPRKDTDGYEFIGECYVHGIEKGQAVENLDESRVEWIDIY